MIEDARRFDELDPQVKDMLRRMEPNEVETLKYVASIPKDELRGMMKMFRDVRAVTWFMRWLILTIVAVFIGTVALGESIMKALNWFKGPAGS